MMLELREQALLADPQQLNQLRRHQFIVIVIVIVR